MLTKITNDYFRPLEIDRYILAEIIPSFFGGMFFFTFIFLMFQALRLTDLLIVHGASIFILMKIVFLMCVSFFPKSLPIAFLISILVGFGRLSADSELVALKASGVSLLRMSMPIVFMAIFVSALSIGLNFEWVPKSEFALKQTVLKVSNTKAVSAVKEGAFTSGFFDLLIFADKVDSKTNKLKKVFIFDEREANNPMAVVAEVGELIPLRTESDLSTAAVLKLSQGGIHRSDTVTDTYQKINFGEYKIYLKNEEGGVDQVTKPEMITYDELIKTIQKTDLTTHHGREMRAEYWRRFAMAFSPFIFAFLGIGFGATRTRTIKASAALVAFVILILYYVSLMLFSIASVPNTYLPPGLAMHMPNLIFLLVAIKSFRNASW
jgi:lipopolysaccharide export system permease protein